MADLLKTRTISITPAIPRDDRIRLDQERIGFGSVQDRLLRIIRKDQEAGRYQDDRSSPGTGG